MITDSYIDKKAPATIDMAKVSTTRFATTTNTSNPCNDTLNTTRSDSTHNYHLQEKPQQQQRHLRIPFQVLVDKLQFDKIMDVLIKEHDFDTLLFWLEGKIPQEIPLSMQCTSYANNSNELTGATPLHRIAAVNPPAWIVEALVNCMTEIYRNAPLDATDVLGRTPLHVATSHGSIDAIPVLTWGSAQIVTHTESFITAPLMQDKWLRCPLHWACTHSIGSGNYSSRKPNGDNSNFVNDRPLFSKLLCQPRKVSIDMLDVVRILLSAYPEATIIKDCDGNTPYQLAMEHNADPSIIRLVKDVEQSVREERHCYFSTHNFWGKSNGGETTSITMSESPDPLFPDGFPGEISFEKSMTTTTTNRKLRKKPKSEFDYVTFEC